MFSSSASLMGARELGPYSAANQFLDVLAHYRHRIGLPASTVNWGAWDEMRNASPQIRENYARGGLFPMECSLALSAFDKVISSGTAQAGW